MVVIAGSQFMENLEYQAGDSDLIQQIMKN